MTKIIDLSWVIRGINHRDCVFYIYVGKKEQLLLTSNVTQAAFFSSSAEVLKIFKRLQNVRTIQYTIVPIKIEEI